VRHVPREARRTQQLDGVTATVNFATKGPFEYGDEVTPNTGGEVKDAGYQAHLPAAPSNPLLRTIRPRRSVRCC